IPVATVEGLWRSVLERPMSRAPEFDLSFRPGEAELGSLMQCIDYAVRETLVTQNTPAGRAVGRRLEELLVLKLLAAQPHSHSDEMARHQSAIAPRHVRAAEE